MKLGTEFESHSDKINKYYPMSPRCDEAFKNMQIYKFIYIYIYIYIYICQGRTNTSGHMFNNSPLLQDRKNIQTNPVVVL